MMICACDNSWGVEITHIYVDVAGSVNILYVPLPSHACCVEEFNQMAKDQNSRHFLYIFNLVLLVF